MKIYRLEGTYKELHIRPGTARHRRVRGGNIVTGQFLVRVRIPGGTHHDPHSGGSTQGRSIFSEEKPAWPRKTDKTASLPRTSPP